MSIISPFFGSTILYFIGVTVRLKKVPTTNTKASSIFMAIDSCDDNRLRNKGIYNDKIECEILGGQE
jgi:hypothetical protein